LIELCSQEGLMLESPGVTNARSLQE
jgi:hypothetical protein